MSSTTTGARFHVALNVRDLERSVRFYRDVLGRDPDKQHRGYARFVLDDPPLVLALNSAISVKTGSALAHLGVRVASAAALEAVRAQALAGGYEIRAQHETLCCHSIQEKFWIRDPDGNLWEFYELLDDHPETARPSGAPSRASSSCCSPGSEGA